MSFNTDTSSFFLTQAGPAIRVEGCTIAIRDNSSVYFGVFCLRDVRFRVVFTRQPTGAPGEPFLQLFTCCGTERQLLSAHPMRVSINGVFYDSLDALLRTLTEFLQLCCCCDNG